ncbi:PulJ/GspJ family protein [Patulibacter minatonensis]|uniref:PulJ/GspJ family protein n=1 Tax=Patulibacter minatonensis TaxID=298163 RepID=UPI00047AE7A5|nr:prepilin-type N-terminal cleavage/methylation domain-containing protein [Patulibacter minatonensis]
MTAIHETASDERTSEDGFTLVELLVAMTLGIVVLLATLQAGDLLRTGQQKSSRLTDAQEQSRAVMRTMTTELRQARGPATNISPVASTDAASRSDLIASVYLPDGSTGWVRYCVTSDGQSLLRGQVTDATGTATAPPAPGTCATSETSGGWRYAALVSGRLSAGSQLFDYTTTTCTTYTVACTRTAAAIRAVGIQLSVRESSSSDARSLTTRSAVTLRNVPA